VQLATLSTVAPLTAAMYSQPAVPVQDDASPAVKLHVGAAQASATAATGAV